MSTHLGFRYTPRRRAYLEQEAITIVRSVCKRENRRSHKAEILR